MKKNGNNLAVMALVGAAIAIGFVKEYPVIISLLLFGGALWWWFKKKVQAPAQDRQNDQPTTGPDWSRIQREIDQLFYNHRDLLACLVFIARADGQMRDKERDVIATLCLDLMEYKLVPIQDLGWRLQEIQTLKNNEFEEALGRIVSKGKMVMQLLSSAAEQIIGTQKNVSPGEAYCVDTVNRIFAAPKEM